MDLFDYMKQKTLDNESPLALRMRPRLPFFDNCSSVTGFREIKAASAAEKNALQRIRTPRKIRCSIK